MRIRFLTGLLVAALAAAAAPASAQTPETLTLVCPGSDTQVGMAAPTRAGSMQMPGMKRSGRMGGMGRMNMAPRETIVRAQINVIVEGPQVKLWVSEGLLPPMTKKSADGWYALTDVEVDAAAIKGKAPFGGMMGKSKLAIDRTNGEATLGSFQGLCHPAMTGPEVRSF